MILHIVWNPALGIPIGDLFTIRFYSIFFFMAFLLGVWLMKKIYLKEKMNIQLIEPLLFYVLIATFIGARLGHVLFYDWAYYQNHLIEILLPIMESPNSTVLGIKGYKFIGFRGLASHGATIGIFIASLLYSIRIVKKPFSWILDRIVIPISIGGALVRIGNFFNSEIVGKPSELPWAVEFVNMNYYGESIPRHPAQLYEAIGYILIFILLRYLYFMKNKGNQKWFLFGLFFVCLWTLRFVIEFVKEPQDPGRENWIWIFNTGQVLSIPFILIGIGVLWYSYYKKSKL